MSERGQDTHDTQDTPRPCVGAQGHGPQGTLSEAVPVATVRNDYCLSWSRSSWLCWEGVGSKAIKKARKVTSLMVQWLRPLPIKGMWVLSLVGKVTSHSPYMWHRFHYARHHILTLWHQTTVFMSSQPLYLTSCPLYLCHHIHCVDDITPTVFMRSHPLYMMTSYPLYTTTYSLEL